MSTGLLRFIIFWENKPVRERHSTHFSHKRPERKRTVTSTFGPPSREGQDSPAFHQIRLSSNRLQAGSGGKIRPSNSIEGRKRWKALPAFIGQGMRHDRGSLTCNDCFLRVGVVREVQIGRGAGHPGCVCHSARPPGCDGNCHRHTAATGDIA